jgi:D-apionolactonase
MDGIASRPVRLFGTEEPVADPIVLRAGPLSAELEDGNLRYVRFNGSEMLRAISYIVRDKNWGTYRPQIHNLQILQDGATFSVTYEAVAGDSSQHLPYRARIEGRADGSLHFEADAEPVTRFVTNRTGFVVLHPISGVAGEPCQIEHVDGRIVDSKFPALVDPIQPMMDLRALTHSFAPGLKVTCRMEGDTYEMEDQRNWCDASYKTYVRPLALPWPYALEPGTPVTQRVHLTVTGRAATQTTVPGARLATPIVLGTVPALGIGLEPALARATLTAAPTLRAARPDHVICFHDPGLGHSEESLALQVEAARALGAEAWLEAVIREVDGFADEIRQLGALAHSLGAPFRTVLVSPASDLKSSLPGTVWPPSPPAEALYRAVRAAFPGVQLGGGMFSFFTELNRKRPPAALLDLVTFTTSALVHAGDDRSVTEGLEALPALARSTKSFTDGKPYHVGPSAIGMRMNPYGAAPMDNPSNIRQAMNRMDPRQRGLIGAAFGLGYFANFAREGAQSITLGGGVGEFGHVHAALGYAQPWYDQHPGSLYPNFHVFRGLSALKQNRLVDAPSSIPRDLQAIGGEGSSSRELWLANLTGAPLDAALWGEIAGAISVLDEDSFEKAAADPAYMDRTRAFRSASLVLKPYAVARLVL